MQLLDLFLIPGTYISLLTLTFMEVVLGIDNIIFISIVADRLPPEHRGRARRWGLSLALLFRIVLLMSIGFVVRLNRPLFTVFGFGLSGHDLILLAGGLFLIAKSTLEIHAKLEGKTAEDEIVERSASGFWPLVWQIVILDIVFSFDSVVTAVGLVREIPIMVVAVVLSLFVMLAFSNIISNFVNRYPTIKMLALSFLLMIGTLLFAEGCHLEVPKGYAYFAMAFSMFVEFLNIRARKVAGHKER